MINKDVFLQVLYVKVTLTEIVLPENVSLVQLLV
jgi:hypothetical protein